MSWNRERWGDGLDPAHHHYDGDFPVAEEAEDEFACMAYNG